MRQAIKTKYIGPTNTKSGRVVAQADAGRRVYAWDHELSVPDNHRAAARKFAEELGWHGRWVGGGLVNGYVFVVIDQDELFEVRQ